MATVLLIIYIVILIFLIVNFVKCLKRKSKWSRLFIFEIFSMILSAVFLMYYDILPSSGSMPELTYYIFAALLSFCAMILYSIIFGITLITKLILYLLEKKEQGKKLFPKIAIIFAIILLLCGVYALILVLIRM